MSKVECLVLRWASRVLKNPNNAASFEMPLSRLLRKVAPIARFPEEDFPGKFVSKGRADFFSSLLEVRRLRRLFGILQTSSMRSSRAFPCGFGPRAPTSRRLFRASQRT